MTAGTASSPPGGWAGRLSASSRICMPTWRGFSRRAARCALYEGEDVLAEVDEVDLITLEPGRSFPLREAWQRRLIWRDVTGRLALMNPGLRPVTLRKDYELFVFVCQQWWDLLYINAVKGWQDHCRTSICWLDELWAAALPHHKHWLPTLDRFDHVVLSFSGTVALAAQTLGRPCHHLPTAVDAIRFSPAPNPPTRVIDVYSIGRRWEGVHRALVDLAAKRDIFYIHDTAVDAGDMQPEDHRQHRDLLGNLAKRSLCFMVAPAKMNAPGETKGQSELGYRFFEGAAAGAVLIGQRPDSDSFGTLLGWPDSVIPILPDGSDVAGVLAALRAEPTRANRISRRNAQEALLRHDWVYRWRRILELAGLEPRPKLLERERRLKDMARTLADG